MKAAPVVFAAAHLASPALAAIQCPGTFNSITANEWIVKIDPGWNLGNTLDAVPNEGSWNNPPVTPETFDEVKKVGFRSVRLPVTWTTKIGPAPDYKIDAKWLDRVAEVTKQITDRGLYALVNVHHDSWEWFDFSTGGANVNELQKKFEKVWTQLATKLACTSSLVAFEPMNEVKGTTKEHGDIMNKMNEIFLKAINDVGGFNPQRVVNLVGLGEDGPKTSQFFKKPPGNWKNPWAIQYHYYSPYDFVFGAWGKTIWGSQEDKTAMENDIKMVRGNFTNVPLVIGEYAASAATTESAARWKWFDHLITTAKKYNTATVLWDNGADSFLDRKARVWRDSTAIEIIMNAQKGIKNSLPDSTEDNKATSQWTSAYIFHKSKDDVKAQSLPFLLNGNTVKKISVGDKTLATPGDYSVSGGKDKANITFTKDFLDKYVSPYALPGIKANLTVEFSAGAKTVIEIVQWDVPQLTGAKSSKAVGGKDLEIPILWKGLPRLAAVKATFNDGEFLADDWTKYMGQLQAGYATYNNHWKSDATKLILTKGAVDAVVSKKKQATFTFEFFPRVPGNSLSYTITP